MTEQNPSVPQPNPQNQPGAQTPPPTNKKSWLKRILIGVGVIVVLLIVLVLLAPTIASTGAVRGIVVGKVNDNLNGKVQINDWHLGWTGGLVVEGVRVFDDQQKQILELRKASTQLSLLDAIKGKLDLGKTSVEGLDFTFVQYADGTNNFAKLAKETPEAKHQPKEEKPTEPSKLPNITGDFSVDARGTIVSAGQPTVHLNSSQINAKITNINDPIEQSAKLEVQVESGKPGTLEASGTVDAIDNNEVNLKKLVADEKVILKDLDLAAANTALAQSKVSIGGTANGSLQIAAQSIESGDVKGELVVDTFSATGEALKGDTYKTSKLSVPIAVARRGEGETATIAVQPLAVRFDQGSIEITANAPQKALMELAELIPAAIQSATGTPATQEYALAGGKGNAKVVANIDLAALAKQLPNTIGLQKDVVINKGKLAHTTDLAFAADGAKIHTSTDITDVAGTNAGKPVTLDPIHAGVDLSAIPGKQPQLADVKLGLKSGFATVNGGGANLSKLNINGAFDLSKAQQQADQFVDLSKTINGPDTTQKVSLAGTGTFAVTTNGDLLAENAQTPVTANANLNNIKVTGIEALPAPIEQDQLRLTSSATLVKAKKVMQAIQKLAVALQTGDASAPVVDVALAGDVNLSPKVTAPNFELTKFNVSDLKKAQAQFGAFVPQLKQEGINIENGALYVSAGGTYDGNTFKLTKPLSLSMRSLQMTKASTQPSAQPVVVLNKQNMKVDIAGEVKTAGGVGANLSTLSITTDPPIFTVSKSGDQPLVVQMSEQGGLQDGKGTLALTADLKKLNDIGQAFGGQVKAKTASSGELTSGTLSANVALNHPAGKGTTIDLTGNVDSLSITTAQKPITNEKVTLAFSAASPEDFSSVSVTKGNINSSFATVNIGETTIQLTNKANPATAPSTFDMLQKANVDINVPDIPKLYAVANAFTPPSTQPAATTQPVEPLEIISGSMSAKLNVARNANTTTVNVTNTQISDLALKRGAKSYKFAKPITLALAADLAAATSVDSLTVSQLNGDLGGVATLSMPSKIAVTNLQSEKPSANGAIGLNGSLANVTPLLAVIQGGEELPYRGDFAIAQNIATQNDNVTLKGDITTKKFEVLDATDRTKVVFAEPVVSISNDLVANVAQKNATINSLAIDMPKSNAVGVKLTGAIRDWETKREIDPSNPIKLLLAYDLEKIWPIVHPMMVKPGEEDQFKDLKIAGKYEKQFNVTGSFPATDSPKDPAIKHLTAGGEFVIDMLNTSGAEIQKLAIPIHLYDGKVAIEYADKPRGKNAAADAVFNGGILRLSGLTVDLTGDQPRLWSPKNQLLVNNASINELLGETLGKYVNPVFANNKRAKGLLDVTIQECRGLALGQDMKTEKSGDVKILFSLTDMDIANPLGSLIGGSFVNSLGSFLGSDTDVTAGQSDTFEGEIKNGALSISKGVTNTDVTLMLVDPRTPEASAVKPGQKKPKPILMPMSFKGDIRLADLKQNLNVNIAPGLIGKFLPKKWAPKVADALPGGLPLAMRGTTPAPKIEWGDVVGKLGANLVGGEIGNLLGGDKDKKNNATKDGTKNPDNIGGVIGDILGGNKDQKKDDSKDASPPKKKKK
jgi:hypothetical protein